MKWKYTLLLAGLLFACTQIGFAQSTTVKGTVTNAQTGKPMIGVNILVVGTSTGTVTNVNGHYSLTVSSQQDTLRFSFIGFQTKAVPINGRAIINITLKPKVLVGQQLVVTGYQRQRKESLTGSVAVVDVKKIKESSTSNNPIKALQGHVPGVFVSADGNPNGKVSIEIRGTTTLNNNSPLYIIDGIPTKGGLNMLNMHDVKSIQVLKGTAAASIYGARASNGVIIITTKKGTTGKTQVSFSSSLSIQKYTTKLSVLNTIQRGRVVWQAAINDGTDPANIPNYSYKWHVNTDGVAILDKVLVPKWISKKLGIKTANTDWFDKISRTGLIQNYNLSVSTGSNNSNARFSLGYFNNKGIVKQNDFKRLTFRINSQYSLLDNNRLTIGETFSIAGSKEHPMPSGAGGTPLNLALIVQPMIPVHTINGGWGGPWGGGFGDRDNPVRLIHDNRWDYTNNARIIGSAFLNFNILKNLQFKTNFSLNYSGFAGKNYSLTYHSGFLKRNVNSLDKYQGSKINWSWDNTLNYQLNINDNQFKILVGMEMLKTRWANFSAGRREFSLQTPNYFYLDAGTGTKNNSGSGGGFSLLSYFGKVNYQFKGKYLASITLRRDGSSRFGVNNRFGFFPAFSVGWRLSEENFIKNNVNFISNLKLRFGWGETGNQQIANNARFSIYIPNYGDDDTWGPSNGTAYDINGNDSGVLPAGFYKVQQGNPNLKWETTTGIDFGINFGFFDQMLTGAFDYYQKKTTDILIRPPYPGVMGDGGSQWLNGASLVNHGFEMSLTYKNTIGDFNYNISGNISHYNDKITKLPKNVANAYPGNGVKTIIGHSPNTFFGYVAEGLFTSKKELNNSAKQPGKGLGRIRYKDLNHDRKITPLDQSYIGISEPNYVYGINLGLNYKNFDFSVFFQGVKGLWVNNAYATYTDFVSLWSGVNYGTRTLHAWTPQNPNSTIPALTLTDDNSESRFSTYYVQKGDYLKWRSLVIGYNLAPMILKGLDKFRIYLSAENLLILKSKGKRHFTGPDPENPSAAFPRPLKVTFGVNITF